MKIDIHSIKTYCQRQIKKMGKVNEHSMELETVLDMILKKEKKQKKINKKADAWQERFNP